MSDPQDPLEPTGADPYGAPAPPPPPRADAPPVSASSRAEAWAPDPEPLRLSGGQAAAVGVISGCAALALLCGIGGMAFALVSVRSLPAMVPPGGGGGTAAESPQDLAGRAKVQETMEALADHLAATTAPFGEDLPEAPPPDPWGRPIRWLRLTRDSGKLQSAGPDGEFGTGDDVIVPVVR